MYDQTTTMYVAFGGLAIIGLLGLSFWILVACVLKKLARAAIRQAGRDWRGEK